MRLFELFKKRIKATKYERKFFSQQEIKEMWFKEKQLPRTTQGIDKPSKRKYWGRYR